MNRSTRKTTAGVMLIALVASIAGFLVFTPAARRADIIETVTGETPEKKVAAYVRAVARGRERAALAAWEPPARPPDRASALDERRRDVTRELIAAGIEPDFDILKVEWWRTCCIPGVIDKPREAGGARMRVRLRDRDGSPRVYVFDVFTRGGGYWGGATGYLPRRWALRDVYPINEEPLHWRWGQNGDPGP